MVARKAGGRIIMVSSVNQVTVNRGIAHYVATKGGVMQLAKAMALELAPAGITVNLIAPGTIETDLNRASSPSPRTVRRSSASFPWTASAGPRTSRGRRSSSRATPPRTSPAPPSSSTAG